MIWKSSARSPYDLKIISQVPLWFENHQPGPPMIWKSSARSPYDLKIISQVPLWFENHQPGPPMIWKSSARSPYDLKIISQVPLWFENHQPGPPIIKMIRKPKKKSPTSPAFEEQPRCARTKSRPHRWNRCRPRGCRQAKIRPGRNPLAAQPHGADDDFGTFKKGAVVDVSWRRGHNLVKSPWWKTQVQPRE